jgi:hypothetical protein
MSTEALSTGDADAIGVEAYVYLYPLILMDITRRVMTGVPPDVKPGSGPMNVFHHMRAFPPADAREVVRLNFDTLYSVAWLDLTGGPVVISMPDTGGRYYLLPLMDMWTDVFAVPGKRTSGTGAGKFAVVPAGWSGSLPDGLERIVAPTPFVWIIGRTQTNGPRDYEAVHAVQDGFLVTPLSQRGRGPAPADMEIDPGVDMETPPMVQVDTMPADRYFAHGAELMKLHPPHVTDWSMVARMRRIGIEPGTSFEIDRAPPAIRGALERAVVAGLQRMRDRVPTLARVANGWQMNTDTMGVYGDNYLKRAVVAMMGLGANPAEDAVYPFAASDADGRPIDGEDRYVLHFEQDQLPPVDAFWSVTMYDEQGYPVANPINRFAIGDRDALRYNADGSLDLYLQHESPGPGRESNWLPSPSAGTLGVTMRLYAPRMEILDGRWNPPPLRRVEPMP